MTTPFVSFLCPTYGRAPYELSFLGEKIYWFLKQIYPADKKELIILSDSDSQILRVGNQLVEKNVRIVNYPHRFSTLGDKMNALIALAKGDVLMVDEDDDISLPNRASNAVANLKDWDFYDPGARWFQPGPFEGLVLDAKNCTHHAACYKRGGVFYPSAMGNQDQLISNWAKHPESKLNVRFDKVLDPVKIDYVYRFGVSKLHLSAYVDRDKVWKENTATPGTFFINPTMVRDYAKEVSDLISFKKVKVNQ